MAFADITDYQSIHGTDLDDSIVEARLERATSQIQTACNQTISRATSAIGIKGTWDRELTLPEWPVVSVASVSVNGRTVTMSGVEVTTRSLLWPTSAYGGQGARGGFPANWGGPECIVDIVYTHGFEPIPDDVKWLCVDLAATANAIPVGVRSESGTLEDYTEQIAYDLKGEGTSSTLAAIVRRYGR